ncbi:MAG: sensor domain-containing diguanylate cyclase [Elusimicrobiota bacterium]
MDTSKIARPHERLASPLIYLSTEFIRAKEYLEAIVASTSDAICTTDMQGRIIYFSPGAEKMFGRQYRDAMGMHVSRFYAGGRREAERIMRLVLDNGSISDYETVVRARDGRRVHISMSASVIRDRRGTIIGTLGISKDVSRRVELERRLRTMTVTDELTGLYNQRHFAERVSAEVQRTKRQRQKLSMLLLDLDRFKQANDRWGHSEGNRILREIAGILNDSIRRDVDLAFRYGGDEFVVLLPGLGPRQAERVARRIRKASGEKPYAELVSLSIGIASLRRGDSPEDLVDRADTRMYADKRRRKRADSSRA